MTVFKFATLGLALTLCVAPGFAQSREMNDEQISAFARAGSMILLSHRCQEPLDDAELIDFAQQKAREALTASGLDDERVDEIVSHMIASADTGGPSFREATCRDWLPDDLRRP